MDENIREVHELPIGWSSTLRGTSFQILSSERSWQDAVSHVRDQAQKLQAAEI